MEVTLPTQSQGTDQDEQTVSEGYILACVKNTVLTMLCCVCRSRLLVAVREAVAL